VKLTDGALFQVLLGTSNVSALRQVLNNLFSGPTAGKELGLGLGETPLDIRHKTVVSAGCPELVRVLEIHGLVGTTCCNSTTVR
jgi:hypothetical protein